MSRISSVFLPTNEYLGVMWTLEGVKDVAVINHGTGGCNFYELVTASKRTRELIYNRFCSTGMEQEDVALSGGEDKLKSVIQEMAARDDVSLIVIVTNPVSSLIGVDIEALAREAATHIKQSILTFNNKAWKEQAENGVEETLYNLITHFCPKPMQDQINKEITATTKVNVIGPTAETFKWEADEKELKRLLKLLDSEVEIITTYETNTAQLKEMSKANLNIVTRKAGLKVAQYLQDYYGIPYIYGLPYGQNGTLQWLEQAAKLLNEEILTKQLEKELAFSSHHYFETISGGEFYQKEWKVALACSPVMAIGLTRMVREEWNFPVEAIRLTQQPSDMELEQIRSLGVKEVLVMPSEFEWKKLLQKGKPFILMGSAEDRALAKDVPVSLRIVEPSFDTFTFYKGNPLVGFEGYQSLTQDLLNEISRYSNTKRTINGGS